jgi:hypothetical protein
MGLSRGRWLYQPLREKQKTWFVVGVVQEKGEMLLTTWKSEQTEHIIASTVMKLESGGELHLNSGSYFFMYHYTKFHTRRRRLVIDEKVAHDHNDIHS